MDPARARRCEYRNAEPAPDPFASPEAALEGCEHLATDQQC